MAQFNDLIVTGAARFVNQISGTFERAITDENGSNIASTYMKKGVDYVTAGQRSGYPIGSYVTAEGYNTIALGDYSHAEGYYTEADGVAAHAEGYYTFAGGKHAHAEGCQTLGNFQAGHAEGEGSRTRNDYSHAEGYYTETWGLASHADGYYTYTGSLADYSHASGLYTRAESKWQLVIGQYNIADDANKYLFIIGNGTSTDARKNAFTVSTKGMPIMGYTNGVMPSTLPDIGSVTNEQQLIPILRYLNGCFGTVIFTSVIGGRRPGRYNFIYIPHRTGGENGAALNDNCNYGSLILFALENPSWSAIYSNSAYFLRYSNQAYSGPVRFC